MPARWRACRGVRALEVSGDLLYGLIAPSYPTSADVMSVTNSFSKWLISGDFSHATDTLSPKMAHI